MKRDFKQEEIVEIKEKLIAFLGKKGINNLIKAEKENRLIIVWQASIGEVIGRELRNFLLDTFPNIFDIFNDYGEFEDWSFEFAKLIIKAEEK